MAQNIFSSINPTTTSGISLATILNDFKDAYVSGNSGTSRPSTLAAGGMWVDTTNNGSGLWDLKLYDGTTDITLFTINLTSQSVAIADAENLLTVKKTSDDNYGPIIEMFKKRIADGGQTKINDVCGEMKFSGVTASGVKETVALIRVTVDEDVTATEHGSTMAIFTTDINTPNMVERIKFDSSGNVGIGITPEEKLHVDGNIKSTGNVSSVDGNFTGNVGAVDGNFTGNVGAVDGNFTGDVETVNLTVTGIFNAAETHLGLITEIKDACLVVNKDGTQADANAQGAGIQVSMSDATHAKVSYNSSLTSKFEAGEVGSLKEVVTTEHTQTIKNKKFVAGNNSFVDDTDDTKTLKVDTSSSTTGADTTLKTNSTVDREISLPDETGILSTQAYAQAQGIKFAIVFGG